MRQTFVKQLRTLLESEVDEAEIIIAIKGIGKNLQEMIEKLGRLTNEDLPPLTDQMRDTYGTPVATNFQNSTSQSLQSVMDSLYGAKEGVDATVQNLASGNGDTIVDVDMDNEIGGEDEFGLGGEDEFGLGGEDEFGLGGEDELGLGSEDEFGLGGEEDEFGGEQPLGRVKKESKANIRNRLAERSRAVRRAKKIKEVRTRMASRRKTA